MMSQNFFLLIFIHIFLFFPSLLSKSIDYQTLSSLLKDAKKKSKILDDKLKLLSLYNNQSYFQRYEEEFIELSKNALDLLSYNKKLSYLSMKYHCDDCQESLKEMEIILQNKMIGIDKVLEEVAQLLLRFNSDESNFDNEFSRCEAYQDMRRVQNQRSFCLEKKDTDCLRTSFVQSNLMIEDYEECFNSLFKQMGLTTNYFMN